MLQWMGGSRRKVSTSRRSTQSRQKQYFEQRKRQNQNIGLEHYADGKNKRAAQHEEPRSLDILSLINVTSVAQECEPVRAAMVQGCRSGCSITGENPEADNPEVHCNALIHSLTHLDPTDKVSTADFSDLNAAKAELRRQKEKKVSPNKVSSSTHPENFPSSHKFMKAIAPDEQKKSSENELSVLDILDDNKLHAYSEQRSEHEAHVAFSVRGLGKIGTETPVHSPRETNRVFFNDFHSLPKAAKRLHASMNITQATDDLEAELNQIMHDTEKSSESPFKSRATTDFLGFSRRTEFINRRFMPFDAINYSSNNFNNEEETFCSGINKKNEQKYNARFGFLDDKFLDKRKYAVSEMIRPFQVEYDPSQSLRAANHEVCDYGFEDPCMVNKRVRENTWNEYDIPEFPKMFTSEKDYEMMAQDDERHAPLVHRWGFTSAMEQSFQPSLDKGDTMDTSSLLSEESCSSGAVRGEHNKTSALSFVKLKAPKKGHSTNHWKSSEKNVNCHCMEKIMHANINEVHHEKNPKAVGDHKDALNLLMPRTSYFFKESPEVQRMSEPWHGFSFGEGFTSVHRESYLNKESCDRHKFDPLLDHTPSAGCLFDKDVLQPVYSAQSNDSHSFSSITSGWMKPDVGLASRVEGQPPYSFCVFNLEKDDEVHNVSRRDVGNEDTYELAFVPTNCGQALQEQPKGMSIGSSDLSSGNGKSADFVDFKDSCSEHGDANDENLEPIESSKARNSPEHGEETPSSTSERPFKLKECINIEPNNNDATIPLPVQSGKEENKIFRDGVSNNGCEQHCSSNLSYQEPIEIVVSVNPSCFVDVLEYGLLVHL